MFGSYCWESHLEKPRGLTLKQISYSSHYQLVLRGFEVELILSNLLSQFIKPKRVFISIKWNLDSIKIDEPKRCTILRGMLRIPHWKDQSNWHFLQDRVTSFITNWFWDETSYYQILISYASILLMSKKKKPIHVRRFVQQMYSCKWMRVEFWWLSKIVV